MRTLFTAPSGNRLVSVQVALLLTLCCSVVAHADTGSKPASAAPAAKAPVRWQKVTMDELTLSMPASAKSIGGNALMTHYWAAVQGDSALFAMALSRKTMKEGVADDVMLKAAYNLVINSLADADIISRDAAGKVTRIPKSEQTLTLPGHTGQEWVETVQGTPVTCRGYASKDNVYFAMTINSKDEAVNNTFLDSMSFATKPGAAAP